MANRYRRESGPAPPSLQGSALEPAFARPLHSRSVRVNGQEPVLQRRPDMPARLGIRQELMLDGRRASDSARTVRSAALRARFRASCVRGPTYPGEGTGSRRESVPRACGAHSGLRSGRDQDPCGYAWCDPAQGHEAGGPAPSGWRGTGLSGLRMPAGCACRRSARSGRIAALQEASGSYPCAAASNPAD